MSNHVFLCRKSPKRLNLVEKVPTNFKIYNSFIKQQGVVFYYIKGIFEETLPQTLRLSNPLTFRLYLNLANNNPFWICYLC